MLTDRIHAAHRPFVWWLVGGAYIRKILPLTRNVGAPHASTSVTSGSARQNARTRASGSLVFAAFGFAAFGFVSRLVAFFAAAFLAVFFFAAMMSSACVR